MNKEDIQKRIEKAFEGIVLGNGIGLYEAQAMDDRESLEVRKKARQNDEKENWKLLDYKELQRCNSSLSFFDANGMQFHLPAYIIAELKEEIDKFSIFYLTYLDEHFQSKFASLNHAQREAIVMYLELCLQEDEYGFYPTIKNH